MDLNLSAGSASAYSRNHEETYWLARLSEAKAMAVRPDGFPLPFAVSLFNADYVDLRFSERSVVVEITNAGIAALRMRGALRR